MSTLEGAQATRLFNAIRTIKGGELTQAEVDAVNRALLVEVAAVARTGRTVSPRGRAMMHAFEGCAKLRSDGRYEAYPDPGSRDGTPWTIGFGSTGPDVKRGTVWTLAQCEARFDHDLGKFEAGVSLLIGTAPTTQNQFDALVSIAYNIGLDIDADDKAEGLGDSTLLKRHLVGDYAGAKAAFGSWVFNDGKKMAGLERRRAAEAALYGSAA